MPTLTLTTKRQATFPAETCRELGLKPGDQVELEVRNEEEGRVWILRRRQSRTRNWVGCLAKHVSRVEDHSMEAVRESIAKARRDPEARA